MPFFSSIFNPWLIESMNAEFYLESYMLWLSLASFQGTSLGTGPGSLALFLNGSFLQPDLSVSDRRQEETYVFLTGGKNDAA
jgi:hypothetical protein